ncbi:hypothetical protein LOTGIDRAFT_217206 [Lottia gigantea]|uniref:Sjoegren syndrome/scleroderma autoantigen 1 n=1 Tax=Lottia gigantea TaxID=225164 RepID=V4BSP7_LOTGI|nr:hypothetical protein LOTGIDRAFT_217206 [Lottia gigantea]ESO92059.1 hypothetical protein LOTGIDRAFT_217206 [Lottia gigantea]
MASRLGGFDDIHWTPPTEAELKIIEARRERSDKISKLMGDYLLKGYKMLGITCRECETILLQDRHGKNYCVACQDLDSDTDKDNPLINETAALSQIREQQLRPVACNPPQITQPAYQASLPKPQNQLTVLRQNSNIDIGILNDSVSILQDKLKWASEELKKTVSVEYSIQLCQLIKSSAEAIKSCQQAQSS